jgi:hypothetical protein
MTIYLHKSCFMSSPVFLESALDAVQRKVDDPSLSLLVSVEPDSFSFTPFWSDALVLSSLNSTFLVVRISTSDAISDFSELYAVPAIPCLLYFAPGADEPTRTWDAKFPTVDEFYAFIISKLEMPTINRRPPTAQTSKVSLAYGAAKFTTEFPPGATIGDLRAWAQLQVSVNCRLIVALNGTELSNDDRMTLAAADFVPSVALKAEPIEHLSGEETIPSITPDVETREVRPREVRRTVTADRRTVLRRVIEFLNPFPGVVEIEDFFAVKDE